MTQVNAIILAAGQSSRMKSKTSKVLHPVAGQALIHYVLNTTQELRVDKTVVVISPDGQAIESAVAPIPSAIQDEALGTAHAVQAGLPALEGMSGFLLVLYGDTPFVSAETLQKMIATATTKKASIVVLGFTPTDPAQYGRLIVDASGNLKKIVEFREATDAEKAVTFCNSGVMLFRAEEAADLLNAVDNKNAKGEYYLTDTVEIAKSRGGKAFTVAADESELLGVNNRKDLALAENVVQEKLRHAALENGVSMVAPETVYLAADTVFERDVLIEPFVRFGRGVRVGEDSVIKSFSHIEGAIIGKNCAIGPHARIRPGTEIGDGSKIGNFVELKKAKIADKVAISHLSYIGDASVGTGANIGAGTITCNYDGFSKYQTEIGSGAFIGSNSALVAPVSIGDGAIIAAGSVITKNVETDALAVTRSPQKSLKEGGKKFRERQKKSD
ncbi:MAG: bifunctional UDP-N-acetylglucosamine diphosphorylase/glucosamine-1-phosphate N-acetyltransferase GlmU [Alphaproteobacteria bacterium]